MDRARGNRSAEPSLDGVLCLPAVPWHRYSQGRGLGLAAGKGQASRGQRFSFPLGAIGAENLDHRAQPSGGGAGARPVPQAKLPPEWTQPLAKGFLALVSCVQTEGRLTQQLANERNAMAALLAQKIVVAHASPGGALTQQLEQWRTEGRETQVLVDGP